MGIVGQAVLNDPTGRTTHELDVIALADGEQLHAQRAVIRAIGEAKATNRTRSVGDLHRLERIRVLLGERGHDATHARLLLFSRTGFTAGLLDAARTRSDVELVDLTRLYTGD